MKIIFIQGERIYLRPLKKDDIDGNYSNWLNDPLINKFNSHGRFTKNKSELIDYVTKVSSSKNDLVLAIVTKDSNEHIGNISLQNINWIDSNAEIAFILGEINYWGKGIMFEAGELIIQHAFKKLNLHRVYCATAENNVGMKKLAMKLGMKKEGVRKDAIFNDGKFLDIIEFGIIKGQ